MALRSCRQSCQMAPQVPKHRLSTMRSVCHTFVPQTAAVTLSSTCIMCSTAALFDLQTRL